MGVGGLREGRLELELVKNLIKNLPDEAKSFMKKHFHEFATHFAMTENSALIRFVAHSFMYLYKPDITMKLFKTKLEAITWLKSL